MTDIATPAPATTPSAVAGTPPASPDHFVQFYEKDSVLVESLARYLRDGLESGAAALAILTPEHASGLDALWKAQGFDCAWARERGQLALLDAAATLESLCVDDSPDPRLFEERVGSIIAEGCRRFGHVVAFGEMVGLLWARGRHGDAVRLESFWNLLARHHRFALYCAYRMSDGSACGSPEAFREVCEAHSHVRPAESYFEQRGEGDPLRFLAQLQQRAGALMREIEARQRAEQELADFVDNALMGLHRIGPDGTILWANRAELDLLGYEAREYVGRNIAEFHADPELLGRIMDRLAAGESMRDMPAKLRGKDGTVRHVLISSNPLMRDGKVVNTRCFTRDVSDRWLAQEALRERGAVLHLAMQGARMGYWVGDIERGTLRGSSELAGLLGLSGAVDWTTREFLALVHPHDRESFRRTLDDAIHGRREFLIEFRVRSDVSGWRWLEGRGEAVYDEHGLARRFYGVCMDVTARKRAEEQLAHMAAVVDSAEDAIVSKTLDGVIKSWNGGATRIFGYDADEMIGRPITVIIPPELHAEEAHILSRIRAGERVEHYVTTRVAKDGTKRKVSITVSPVRNAAGQIIGASKIGRLVA
jgi:PAS domain S-box-containing protein